MKRQVSINSNGYRVRSSVFCLLSVLVVLLAQTVTVRNVGAANLYGSDIKYLRHTSVVDWNLYIEMSELSVAFNEIPGTYINSAIDSYHLELCKSVDSPLFLFQTQNTWSDRRPDLSVVLPKQNDGPTDQKQRNKLRNQYRMWSGRKIRGNSGLYRTGGMDGMQNEYEKTGITRTYVALAALNVRI
ncbi:MAG: hypothetical protein ACYSWP_06065 [Planctomycetota bacterium]